MTLQYPSENNKILVPLNRQSLLDEILKQNHHPTSTTSPESDIFFKEFKVNKRFKKSHKNLEFNDNDLQKSTPLAGLLKDKRSKVKLSRQIWNFLTAPIKYVFHPSPQPIKTEQAINKQADNKLKELMCDLKLTYDRNFLSPNSTNETNKNHKFNMDADPTIMMLYILLKIYKRGEENCKEAFKNWEKTNEIAKIRAHEKQQITIHTSNLESTINKTNILIQSSIGICSIATGIVGYIAGFPIATSISIIGGLVSTFGRFAKSIGNFMSKVNPNQLGIITKGMNLAAVSVVAKNKANTELLSFNINQIQSMSSMIAQDLARLYQVQFTIMGMIQSFMQSRKETYSAIRIG